ncbi:GAF and ANTAR domain-containing protein [Arthrobacter zhaoguopingii]|uniref:GAF and ANTAR domain-containing protein n=1 Tax=Arthrobacter zhaoguopingii TaxID=2681491 RepID=UPI001FF01112|nr:GAF and ANTAR domain-containing protein [Arthrobacter zhaoguopingii]
MSEPLQSTPNPLRGRDDGAGPGAGLSAPFVKRGNVTGAAVSAFTASNAETLLSATDPVAQTLEEAQFDLGEGPRWDAVRTRLPVLIPDVRENAFLQWPAFGEVLARLEVGALFVFPLTVGAIDLGVVELHRTSPGSLSGSERLAVEVLAGETAWALLRWTLQDAQPGAPAIFPSVGDSNTGTGATPGTASAPAGLPNSRREIHQATGMVLAQADVSAAQALLLLRGHAFSHQQTLHQTALQVIRRELNFTPPDGTSPERPGLA